MPYNPYTKQKDKNIVTAIRWLRLYAEVPGISWNKLILHEYDCNALAVSAQYLFDGDLTRAWGTSHIGLLMKGHADYIGTCDLYAEENNGLYRPNINLRNHINSYNIKTFRAIDKLYSLGTLDKKEVDKVIARYVDSPEFPRICEVILGKPRRILAFVLHRSSSKFEENMQIIARMQKCLHQTRRAKIPVTILD